MNLAFHRVHLPMFCHQLPKIWDVLMSLLGALCPGLITETEESKDIMFWDPQGDLEFEEIKHTEMYAIFS